MLIKSISSEVKDVDEARGIVKFYFSIFGNIDSDGDITMQGAFAKTIKENFKRIKHFKNHSRWDAPGVIQELYEDNTGGVAVSKLILDSQLGKDTFAEYKAGAITEHSFGYEIMKSEFEDIENRRVQKLLELKLNEVSSLTAWGANALTETLDVKNEKELFAYLEKLESLKKGDFSDEYFAKLENKIAAVQKYLTSLREPPVHSLEPVEYILQHSKMFN